MTAFRDEVRAWLEEHLSGGFAHARGLGGPGREHEGHEVRLAWERLLGAAGWTCLGWPKEYGGRDASLADQVVFHEEYARAAAPARVGHIGEGLIGPTILEFGTEEQKRRFLPPIQRGEELWCQGYSEPEAGSDLAGVQTRARLEDGEWVITGQKVWTSLAHVADWCFVLARTEPGSQRHRGLSYLLVPMDRPGVEVRPIVQLTGTSEFNEVFFDGARTAAANILGAPGEGWRVAMATLGYERGASTLGQQIGFQREFEQVVAVAKRTGAAEDPIIRDRLVRSWLELRIMRLNALRTMTSLSAGEPGPEVSIAKLYWSEWHRRLGELAQAVQGRAGLVADGPPYDLNDLQRLYLFSRADTIYAGSSEIQRNIIAERTLGLPRG
ncbi:acyl-CoA dehydrogenase family protein [Planomonospora venezuelensis]|uniref:Alkylation response protein AidB-like acyl-CoA dehydrogenase n=1 Tax=Planomonospora venezuelensis TaxID=1999 RepID=A0A841DAG5_PLAVE|nr:acyl-CoA dehydrogenase family protein [Planomonospora venezuelensis]MBB5965677.1 alkylation response protein AidB-like acyl-CoA dehydrogenase [Planomonospora venezuelensis]GIN02521.1 acyl-CoA dehydrogenase [Planomonospora venezuelensis]